MPFREQAGAIIPSAIDYEKCPQLPASGGEGHKNNNRGQRC